MPAQIDDASRSPSARRFDLLLFDLDGTLLDTAAELCDAVNDALASLDLAPVTDAEVAAWIGHGTRELLVHALARVQGLDPVQVRAGGGPLAQAAGAFDIAYDMRCGTRSRVYPHVRTVLRALRRRGLPLAVVTNKPRHFTDLLLRRHRLAALFGRVVGGDEVPAKKPDPAGLLACLQHFGVAADRALFVGDSAIDVATARNAGIAIWAVRGGYNQGLAIEDSGPDRVLDDFRPLLEGV